MVTYSVFLMGRDWMLQGIKYCGREKINPLPTPFKCRIWHKSQLLPCEEPAKRNLYFSAVYSLFRGLMFSRHSQNLFCVLHRRVWKVYFLVKPKFI